MLEAVRALMVPSMCESFHIVMDSDNSCQMRPLQTNNRGRMVGGSSEPPSRVNGWLFTERHGGTRCAHRLEGSS